MEDESDRKFVIGVCEIELKSLKKCTTAIRDLKCHLNQSSLQNSKVTAQMFSPNMTGDYGITRGVQFLWDFSSSDPVKNQNLRSYGGLALFVEELLNDRLEKLRTEPIQPLEANDTGSRERVKRDGIRNRIQFGQYTLEEILQFTRHALT